MNVDGGGKEKFGIEQPNDGNGSSGGQHAKLGIVIHLGSCGGKQPKKGIPKPGNEGKPPNAGKGGGGIGGGGIGGGGGGGSTPTYLFDPCKYLYSAFEKAIESNNSLINTFL